MKAFPLLFTGSLVFVIAALAAPRSVSANELKAITGLQLTYWSAFRGTIEQEVRREESGELHLITRVINNNTPEGVPPKSKVMKLRMEDLAPVLAFVNDAAFRKHFSETPIVIKPDGETIELTVRENTFGVMFSSQYPFRSDAQLQLNKVVRHLLTLGGVESPLQPHESVRQP